MRKKNWWTKFPYENFCVMTFFFNEQIVVMKTFHKPTLWWQKIVLSLFWIWKIHPHTYHKIYLTLIAHTQLIVLEVVHVMFYRPILFILIFYYWCALWCIWRHVTTILPFALMSLMLIFLLVLIFLCKFFLFASISSIGPST